MKRIILAAALLSVVGISYANEEMLTPPGYTYVATSSPSGDDFYVHTGTIKRSGDRVIFWSFIRLFLADPKAESYAELIEANCSELRFRTLASRGFAVFNGMGPAVYSNSNASSWDYALPNSITGAVINFACNYKKKK